jgi:hypothetical protein
VPGDHLVDLAEEQPVRINVGVYHFKYLNTKFGGHKDRGHFGGGPSQPSEVQRILFQPYCNTDSDSIRPIPLTSRASNPHTLRSTDSSCLRVPCSSIPSGLSGHGKVGLLA